MIFSQVVNGILLPVIIFFMLRITSDKTIMGAHTNSRWFNLIAWAGAIITASISILMVVMTLIK
jgi:Mn2+/Fe2+ NRAMP family transporter